jgi:glycosyltransferase involved in cell wall biosynthesis
MTEARDEVAYVLPDKLGGVYNYVRNLLAHHRHERFSSAAVRTVNTLTADIQNDEPMPADREVVFSYALPQENLYAVLRRLARVLAGPGVIVANDWIELALTAVHDTGRAVVAITHGDFDYYYDLAVRHRDTIDAFVTYSERMYQRLRELLPDRLEAIFLLPYGVAIPIERRRPGNGPLRLLYVGRLTRDKGVFDLPLIDARLRERGVEVSWTVQGAGPDEAGLKRAWPAADVRWSGMQPMANVLGLYPSHDVLVMPSRHEGLPVALLEAGAAGVVPVVSNLASGIPDVVQPAVTGYRPEPGDVDGFAAAIASLAGDRELLDRLSCGVRDRVASRYDAAVCTEAYERLFAGWRTWKRPRPPFPHLSYGSRLDKPWIPNPVVRAIRSVWAKP